MKTKKFAILAITLATFGISLSSCNNVPKTKTDNKTETVSTNNIKGTEVDVTFLNAVCYAGSTKYYFEDAKGEQIEVSFANDPIDAKGGNPKMPKESLLEDDDPKREGPPSENPKFVGKKFKLIYDIKDKERVLEIRKNF